MPTATLTTKGQVTIPKEVREHLGVDTGDRLSFVVQEDGSVMVKPLTRHVRELVGLLRRPGQRPMPINQMDWASLGVCMRSSDGGDDRSGYQRPVTVSDARRSGTICGAAAFIDAASEREEQLLINPPVLVNLCGFSRQCTSIREGRLPRRSSRSLLQRIEVERLDEARQALGDFRSSKADFSDALIGRINRSLGAKHPVTFDRDVKALETFRLISTANLVTVMS